MEKGKIFFANYILSVLNTVVALIIPVITFPYVSRILGSYNLGIINFAQSYGYYFMHIANFGISSYAVREVSRVRDNRELIYKKSNEIYNINFFFSFISWIIYLIGVFSIGKFRENYLIFLIYSIIIITNFLTLDWLLQSYDDYYFVTIRNTVLRILSVIAVFVFVKKRDDYVIYMLITTISEMGIRFSTLFYSRKKYVNLKIKAKFINFKEHIKALFTLFSFRLVNGISAQLDKLMIGFILTYSDVGVYSAGVKFVLLIIPLIETVGIVMFPTMNIKANTDRDEYVKLLDLNYNIILLMGIPMVAGISLIAPNIIDLFVGNEFIGSTRILRIMAIIIVLCPIGDMLGSKILLIYNKNKELLICSVIVVVTNLVLNVIFIPLFGIDGAAIASSISYLVAVVSRYCFAVKILKFNLLKGIIIKYLLFTIPFIVMYVLAYEFINRGFFELIVYCLICIAMYVSFVIASKDKTGVALINTLLKKTKRREI